MGATMHHPIPGNTCCVVRVDDGAYITVDGAVSSGGGIFWTEFSLARKSR